MDDAQGREYSGKDAEHDEEMAEMFVMKKRCCFCIPYYLGSDRTSTVVLNWWARGINGLKKLREWSEIVAGPRWKTFIRRFNRNKSGNSRHAKFQYDPLSYALNFEEGPGQTGNSEEDDYDYEFRNFSSRYASISISAKSSVDFGKDGPSFT